MKLYSSGDFHVRISVSLNELKLPLINVKNYSPVARLISRISESSLEVEYALNLPFA